MDANDFAIIQRADVAQCAAVFRRFAEKHSQTFDLAAFTQSGQWTPIWEAVFRLLAANHTPIALYGDALLVVRILSRDRAHVNQTTTASQFDTLLRIADLGEQSQPAQSRAPDAVAADALRCMCNMVFQSERCQAMCLKNTAIAGIVRRLRTGKTENVAYELQYFDMKLLFIITGTNADARPKLRDDYYGLVYLTELLEMIIQELGAVALAAGQPLRLADKQVDLVCEILKVLFNITFRTETSVATEEEEAVHMRRLAMGMHDLLRCSALNRDKQTELCVHVVNLLTNVPTECYGELVLRIGEPRPHAGPETAFEGYDVTVLDVLLAFLRQRLMALTCGSSSSMGNMTTSATDGRRLAEQRELLSPVLVVLIKCVRFAPVQRRYVRSVVLPPLRDVQQRPEVGDELRNQLCRLLTSAATQVRDLAAELLFVLCKENVWRMTKYTGYGNAAGMFANRGLLGGGANHRRIGGCNDCHGQQQQRMEVGGSDGAGGMQQQQQQRARCNSLPEYSSDSEDSDTEEYKRVQHAFNPVLGCTEPPRSGNPFEGMSEEQKEHEAMKLVHLMEQLNRSGVVQPCRIGADGRPVPVEHMLELQAALPEQQQAVKHKS